MVFNVFKAFEVGLDAKSWVLPESYEHRFNFCYRSTQDIVNRIYGWIREV